jgi:hypothetical protein
MYRMGLRPYIWRSMTSAGFVCCAGNSDSPEGAAADDSEDDTRGVAAAFLNFVLAVNAFH